MAKKLKTQKSKSVKYKAVIFDFDDTLVESRELKWAQHKVVAKKFYNIDLSDEDLKKHWGKPLSELVRILYKDSDTVENMREVLFSTRQDFMKTVYPEAPTVVSKILDSGIEIGVLSAATNYFIVDDLTRMGFPVERFISVQGDEDTLKHKPHGDVFIPMFDKLATKGIDKKYIVYVGDSLDDLEASLSAGIDFIAITTGLYSREEFLKAGAKVVLSDIREVL